VPSFRLGFGDFRGTVVFTDGDRLETAHRLSVPPDGVTFLTPRTAAIAPGSARRNCCLVTGSSSLAAAISL
jgi:hypothetical protein